jgi:thioredoxin 1
MNRTGLILLFVLMATFGSCQGVAGQKSGTTQNRNVISTVTPQEFEKQMSLHPGVQLLDVRTPGEYKEGHLKNAANLDVESDDFASRAAKLDKAKPVMVYCHSGRRSDIAARKLAEQGFTEIYDLQGGISGWKSAGKPTE